MEHAMKGIFEILRPKPRPNRRRTARLHPVQHRLRRPGRDASLLVPWEARAAECDAKRIPAARGTKLQQLWVRTST